MTRKLPTIAKWLQDNTDFIVTCRETECNTDRHIAGTRLRSPGKGRSGYLLKVETKDFELWYEHSSAETYRTNQEVEEWIQAGMPKQEMTFGENFKPYYR